MSKSTKISRVGTFTLDSHDKKFVSKNFAKLLHAGREIFTNKDLYGHAFQGKEGPISDWVEAKLKSMPSDAVRQCATDLLVIQSDDI